MTTIIDSVGRIRTASDQTYVSSFLTAQNKETGIKAISTAGQNGAAGVLISWTSAVYDTGGFITAYPTTNIVIPQSGWYTVVVNLVPSGANVHMGMVNLRINGSDILADRTSFEATTAQFSLVLSWYWFNKGDVITVYWETSGASITTVTWGECGVACSVWREA